MNFSWETKLQLKWRFNAANCKISATIRSHRAVAGCDKERQVPRCVTLHFFPQPAVTKPRDVIFVFFSFLLPFTAIRFPWVGYTRNKLSQTSRKKKKAEIIANATEYNLCTAEKKQLKRTVPKNILNCQKVFLFLPFLMKVIYDLTPAHPPGPLEECTSAQAWKNGAKYLRSSDLNLIRILRNVSAAVAALSTPCTGNLNFINIHHNSADSKQATPATLKADEVSCWTFGGIDILSAWTLGVGWKLGHGL